MYTTSLIKKEQIAEGTMQFYFKKPDDFVHIAGQTIDITLINPPESDAEGDRRTFSLVSAPHESTLSIATRMRDTSFKRVLGAMSEGGQVTLEGPFGSFVLHENVARPAVLLAGGIGVTPFHAIVTDADHRKLPHKITLFYSNRRPEDSAFLTELTACAASNPNFTFVPTMTEMERSARTWDGEEGYITTEMLKRHELEGMPIYYIAGPQAMVMAMKKMLTDSGVSSDDIRFEEFAGY